MTTTSRTISAITPSPCAAAIAALTVGFLAIGSAGAVAQDGEDAPVKRWPTAAEQVGSPDRGGRFAVATEAARPVVAARPVGAEAPSAVPQRTDRLEQRRSPGGGTRGGAGGGTRAGSGGGRPQGGGRVAVPRGSRPIVSGRPSTVVVRPRYYGRNVYYPYSYTYFGPGYYDAFWWGNGGWGSWGNAGWGWGGWGPGWGGGALYGGGPYGYGYDTGRLRLQVRPRDAEVFVDGYYAGQVDDFDGRLQGLTLETGGYSVEIRKPGWETLTFDVRVTPGRTTNYKGELIAQKP